MATPFLETGRSDALPQPRPPRPTHSRTSPDVDQGHADTADDQQRQQHDRHPRIGRCEHVGRPPAASPPTSAAPAAMATPTANGRSGVCRSGASRSCVETGRVPPHQRPQLARSPAIVELRRDRTVGAQRRQPDDHPRTPRTSSSPAPRSGHDEHVVGGGPRPRRDTGGHTVACAPGRQDGVGHHPAHGDEPDDHGERAGGREHDHADETDERVIG